MTLRAGARVVGKAYPEERVGVFARKNGKIEVVEYSELDPAEAAATFDGESVLPGLLHRADINRKVCVKCLMWGSCRTSDVSAVVLLMLMYAQVMRRKERRARGR
jgi:hypothetical protein